MIRDRVWEVTLLCITVGHMHSSFECQMHITYSFICTEQFNNFVFKCFYWILLILCFFFFFSFSVGGAGVSIVQDKRFIHI